MTTPSHIRAAAALVVCSGTAPATSHLEAASDDDFSLLWNVSGKEA